MTTLIRSALVLAAAGCLPAAHAASGSINSFGASATQVTTGSWVDFSVEYAVNTDAASFTGGNDPVEPAPQEGSQQWIVNWYSRSSESINSVSLQAGGQGFVESPSVPAGSSHTGYWNFQLYFDSVGTHQITLGGDWSGEASSEYGAEVASRNCYLSDPGNSSNLACDGWSYSYPGGVPDTSSISGAFASQTLSIEVTQAVPEPHTLALWLLGGAALATRLRRG